MARTVPPPVEPPPAPLAPLAPQAKLTILDLISLPLAMVGALFALIASVLPWVAGLSQKQSYWEISKVQDVLLVLFVLVVIGLATAVLIAPGVRVVRLLALAAIAGLVDFVFTTPIEFITRDIPVISGKQAGEFLALTAAAMLVGALVLQLLNMRPSADSGRLPPLLLVGLILLGVVGLLQPFVELLKVDHLFSTWEAYTTADILRALIGLAMAGAALGAIFAPRIAAITGAAFLLGCYTVTDNLVGSIEELAASARGAEVFVSLLLLAPLGTVAVVLVAVGSPSLLRRTAE
jgi:hypothetical protein